ncbi:hypothetical protein T09_4634 [Trichinella sp. T9]|nr:hypothetical protein T09_4634 [Trichinella sp. T9]
MQTDRLAEFVGRRHNDRPRFQTQLRNDDDDDGDDDDDDD